MYLIHAVLDLADGWQLLLCSKSLQSVRVPCAGHLSFSLSCGSSTASSGYFLSWNNLVTADWMLQEERQSQQSEHRPTDALGHQVYGGRGQCLRRQNLLQRKPTYLTKLPSTDQYINGLFHLISVHPLQMTRFLDPLGSSPTPLDTVQCSNLPLGQWTVEFTPPGHDHIAHCAPRTVLVWITPEDRPQRGSPTSMDRPRVVPSPCHKSTITSSG